MLETEGPNTMTSKPVWVHRETVSGWTCVLYQETKTSQPTNQSTSQQQQKHLGTVNIFYILKDEKKTGHVEIWKTEKKDLVNFFHMKMQSENRKPNMRQVISQCMSIKTEH